MSNNPTARMDRILCLAELLGMDLRELRLARGLRPGQLAAELGVSRESVVAYESGRASPSLPVVVRLVRWAFEVDHDQAAA